MSANTTETAQPVDATKSLKVFRKSKDLEDFYRFINENGLRREARHALEFIVSRLSKPKVKKKGRGRKAKTLQ